MTKDEFIEFLSWVRYGPKDEPYFSNPTEEEMKSVNDYIQSISKPTGVNFFDFMDEPIRESKRSRIMEKKALHIVMDYIMDHLDKSDDIFEEYIDVYTVWKCKTLQNWKFLISSTILDGMYYEVTYNGDSEEWYLDAYKKFENRVIKDEVENRKTEPETDPCNGCVCDDGKHLMYCINCNGVALKTEPPKIEDEPQDEILREQCRAFIGIVEYTKGADDE